MSQKQKHKIAPHKIAVVLLHYPTTSRTGEIIATAVTNLDLHDISRSCRTYEVDHYYVVTPVKEQQEIVGRILEHWKLPRSKEWHPDRFEALSRLQMVSYFEDVKADLKSRYPDLELEVCMPDARPLPNQLSYQDTRKKWQDEPKTGVKVVVLGTGWGVAPAFYPEVHTYLAPIDGPLGRDGYNHLSVRAAAAVILDRLFGTHN
ncbi:MAG: hypothetical protein JST80_04930 [Bdellovibrionales bacterium]|nr:hypothetical protein [Bdellovibrionales bacterium]